MAYFSRYQVTIVRVCFSFSGRKLNLNLFFCQKDRARFKIHSYTDSRPRPYCKRSNWNIKTKWGLIWFILSLLKIFPNFHGLDLGVCVIELTD